MKAPYFATLKPCAGGFTAFFEQFPKAGTVTSRHRVDVIQSACVLLHDYASGLQPMGSLPAALEFGFDNALKRGNPEPISLTIFDADEA